MALSAQEIKVKVVQILKDLDITAHAVKEGRERNPFEGFVGTANVYAVVRGYEIKRPTRKSFTKFFNQNE